MTEPTSIGLASWNSESRFIYTALEDKLMRLLLGLWLWTNLGVAAAGFLASLWVHFAAWFGGPSPFGELTWLLHIGVFAVLLALWLTRALGLGESGWANWMMGTFMALMCYFIVVFLISSLLPLISSVHSGEARRDLFFSAIWMVFYGSSLMEILAHLNRPMKRRHDTDSKHVAGSPS